MIYFDNSVDSFKNPIQPCTTVDECLDICDLHPEACAAPIDVTRIQTDGVWSREKQNNPFADYYKVIFFGTPFNVYSLLRLLENYKYHTNMIKTFLLLEHEN